jgi:hypothetical protein
MVQGDRDDGLVVRVAAAQSDQRRIEERRAPWVLGARNLRSDGPAIDNRVTDDRIVDEEAAPGEDCGDKRDHGNPASH